MPDRRLFLKTHTTSQHVGEIVGRQLEAVGIAPALFALLTEVRHREPVAPSAISTATGVPPTTLRDNVQRLVERGLVRRTPNPADGRSYLLTLTRRGELMARAADPALRDAYIALEERLARPLADYERTLDELNDALREVLAVLSAPSSAEAAETPAG